MKANKTPKHYPFLSRVAALLLAITFLIRMEWPTAMAESGGLFDSSSLDVYIYFGNTEIYDGMEIDPIGDIHARYSFTATRKELARAKDNLILPKRLKAASEMSEPIIGTDSKGNEIKVGKLIIDEELNIKVEFLDLMDSTDSEIDYGKDSLLEDETDNGISIVENTEPGSGEKADAGVTASEDTEPSGLRDADGGSIASADTESGGEENADSELTASEVTEPGSGENADGKLTASEGMESGSGEDADGEPDAPADTEPGGGQFSYIFQPKLNLLSIAGGVGDGLQAGNAAIDPDEVITVEFDVPVTIDTTGLALNGRRL